MSTHERLGDIPPWTPADRLIKARKVAGLTQPQLAELLGISDKTVKRYESGHAAKRGLVLGWAMACGVNARWLETGEIPDNGPDDGGIDGTPDIRRYPSHPRMANLLQFAREAA